MSPTDFSRPAGVTAVTASSMIAATDGRRRRSERTLFLRRRLVDVICQHPGVATATLECDGQGELWLRVRATIVPDPHAASGVVRLLEARHAGLIDESRQAVLPDGTVVACEDKAEAEADYRAIFQERRLVRHGILVKDGDCIVDAGAGAGLFPLHLNRLASRLRIFAFEPRPSLYRLLQANRAACGMQNVQAFCFGLTHAVRVGTDGGTPLKTLSDLTAEHRMCRVDLLRIDARMNAADVLGGIADGDWPKIRQVVADVDEAEGRLDAVLDMLRRHGFQIAVDRDAARPGAPVATVYAMHADAQQAAAAFAQRTPAGQAPWHNNPALLAEDVRRHVLTRLPDCCQELEVLVAGAG